MQLPRRDADLRAHAELAAVGELGGRVDHDDGAVDPVEEGFGRLRVLGDDGLGVLGAMAGDVGDGRVDAVDHGHRDDGVQVFGFPVLVRRRHHSFVHGTGGGVPAHLAAGGNQILDDGRQTGPGDALVHQQGLRGAADPGAPHLGVEDDLARHVRIGGGVHVGMADAFQVLEQGHLAFRADALDERLAAARHDDVDELRHAQHLADGGAVAGRHPLDRRRGQAGAVEPGAEGVHDGAGGMEAFGAAAQDDGVARLQTQAPGIGGHIGARFIDHADDPKGHAHAGDIQAVGPFPPGHDLAHRIG